MVAPAACDWRLRLRKKATRAAIIATAATPPTVPPAMAPALDVAFWEVAVMLAVDELLVEVIDSVVDVNAVVVDAVVFPGVGVDVGGEPKVLGGTGEDAGAAIDTLSVRTASKC